LTNTAVSASRIYWENKGGFFSPKGVKIPVAVTVFPGEQYQAPRTWTDRAYPKLIYYGRAEKGGHFAAWEQPEIFTAELPAAFRSFRSSVSARPCSARLGTRNAEADRRSHDHRAAIPVARRRQRSSSRRRAQPNARHQGGPLGELRSASPRSAARQGRFGQLLG